MDSNDTIRHRFQHHPPKTPLTADKHRLIREDFSSLAVNLNEMLPEGREKSLCVTKLEEAMFWANAAIARNQS